MIDVIDSRAQLITAMDVFQTRKIEGNGYLTALTLFLSSQDQHGIHSYR